MSDLLSLSHASYNGMHLYPGEQNGFHIQTVDESGFLTSAISCGVHVGTHVDLPRHMKAGTDDTASASPSQFIGSGAKIEVRPDSKTGLIELCPLNLSAPVEFLIFHTAWSRNWGTDTYFSQFPSFSPDWIPVLQDLKLKGIGVDTPSLDSLTEFPFHEKLLPSMVFYENLAACGQLPDRFTFIGMPLKMVGAEASPVHCIALI